MATITVGVDHDKRQVVIACLSADTAKPDVTLQMATEDARTLYHLLAVALREFDPVQDVSGRT